MKNILLPTDLTVQSLWPVRNIVRQLANFQPVIHVVHFLHTPDSISDLLSLKAGKPYRKVPETFLEAYQLLQQKYGTLPGQMHFRFVYGGTLQHLKNFLQANRIDAACVLSNYTYARPFAHSLEVISLLKKSGITLHRLPLHADAQSDYQTLSALLHKNEDSVKPTVFQKAGAITQY